MGIRAIMILGFCGALLASFLVAKISIDEKKHLERALENQTALTNQYRKHAELWRSTLEEYVERIKADAEKIIEFEEKVKDLDAYIQTLHDRDIVCLSDTDTGRVRRLWDEKPLTP
ncbi:MAG: hypothetical protein JSC189_001042 [Candidatus Tokpelaia sp. JSC189]|nr:MAG: hypothetical protein JSC189_001042 [Candidatus Tokpelaia sp. JSC189]